VRVFVHPGLIGPLRTLPDATALIEAAVDSVGG
jgi:hypothetical protein